ncbi:hypothetical protein [Clostridium botulinum]|uniref:Uncharacterized protein n=1 Tax=Clostridium botulinum TaxID=1491 RepID=A0A846HW00_CLOBO|nr:hypothetical protein [Clostridium botulinum]AJE09312.1 hypothetical protein T259_1805 [Clostridium botulinum CDC_1436]AJE12143.1 hypothetical protein T259_2080 [Clostridium botulinum CDC_1436]NEZ91831.1 hypothetical protein [Clostridium botulinum]
MWIRSQDKNLLINANMFNASENIVFSGYEELGKYSSGERAIEVLDMIEDRIMQGSRFDEIQNGKRKTRDFVFQMPDK